MSHTTYLPHDTPESSERLERCLEARGTAEIRAAMDGHLDPALLLYFGIIHDNLLAVNTAIDMGADPSRICISGEYVSPITVYFNEGNHYRSDILTALIERGAPVNTSDKKQPLRWAVRFANRNLADLLIRAGADINAISSEYDPNIRAWRHETPLAYSNRTRRYMHAWLEERGAVSVASISPFLIEVGPTKY